MRRARRRRPSEDPAYEGCPAPRVSRGAPRPAADEPRPTAGHRSAPAAPRGSRRGRGGRTPIEGSREASRHNLRAAGPPAQARRRSSSSHADPAPSVRSVRALAGRGSHPHAIVARRGLNGVQAAHGLAPPRVGRLASDCRATRRTSSSTPRRALRRCPGRPASTDRTHEGSTGTMTEGNSDWTYLADTYWNVLTEDLPAPEFDPRSHAVAMHVAGEPGPMRGPRARPCTSPSWGRSLPADGQGQLRHYRVLAFSRSAW